MFPLIKLVNIIKDYEQLYGKKTWYIPVVYGQFKNGNEISKGTGREDTTEIDNGLACDLPKEEDL